MFCNALKRFSGFFPAAGWALILVLVVPGQAVAEGFSASFQNADIREFINTVSKNLNKTIIIEPSVQGTISVKSYEEMDSEQYYQFFLSVLNVYGFSAVSTAENVIKVIPEQNARAAGVPLVLDGKVPVGDEVIARMVSLHHVSGRELAPLLRQLHNAAEGSIIHYNPSNTVLMTGRASVINQLVSIVKRLDEDASFAVETLHLENASASEVARMSASLQGKTDGGAGDRVYVTVVADERTNSVLVTGDKQATKRMVATLKRLDQNRGSVEAGNTRVIYLKYAKAENLLKVLTGVINEKSNTPSESAALEINTISNNGTTIKADAQTNALIISAPQPVLRDIEKVIARLDIRRAQVLVEAIIAEVSDAEGLNFGIQWMNNRAGGTNFPSAGGSVTTLPEKGMVNALSGATGLATGFYSGNWSGLLNALKTNSKNNILATPSIVTLDNVEAEFTVGQEVPVLTGSQTTSGDNVYNSVERKSVGIKLKVTPQINQGDAVMMNIEQEVSSVSETGVNSELGPTFDTRVVKNAVLIGTGKTVVVGGLLDTSNSNTESNVPLLGRIPLLKYLFGTTTHKVTKRNLMLFIRPTIIRQEEDFTRVSQQSRGKFDRYKMKDIARADMKSSVDRELNLSGEHGGLNNVLDQINAFYAGQPR
ncbi:type II secretion system secretin GspD [Erwinia phyllosphaerae]|uniref:type II secretion system secretin GspD n=1 Tax=Erwinia phyllosphaerae TaxID=2853256 RepID=UPI001FF03423|nr:type II secretion system secretin GspD [Erwinia phyllosphaerae]MBV4368881.1 type II secretion system secretin GspD [Erwinia phyllosphaerae]